MRQKALNRFFSSDITVFVLTDKIVMRRGHSGFGTLLSKPVKLEFNFKSQAHFDSVLELARDSLGIQTGDRWFLALPLQYFSLVNLRLPKIALENLDQAVRYALTRHVPFNLDQAYLEYNKVEQGDFLDISSTVIFKQSLTPFIKAASQAGIMFNSVFPSLAYWADLKGDGVYIHPGPGSGEVLVQVDGKVVMQSWGQGHENLDTFLDESRKLLINIPRLPSTLYIWEGRDKTEPVRSGLGIKPDRTEHLEFDDNSLGQTNSHPSRNRRINLLPRAVLKQRKVASYLVLGGLAFFLLTLLSWPVFKVAGQQKYLAGIERRIQDIELQAEELGLLRNESRQIMSAIEHMSEMSRSYPPVINILRELTAVIPESGWVVSFSYSDSQVTIQGQADSATSVIEAIENSPMFHQVRFSSPVTKSGAKDLFTLVAEVAS